MDDYFGTHPSKDGAQIFQGQAHALLDGLGVGHKKRKDRLRQSVAFDGGEIDMAAEDGDGVVKTPTPKFREIQRFADRLLQELDEAPDGCLLMEDTSSIAGKCNYASVYVATGRCFVYDFFRSIYPRLAKELAETSSRRSCPERRTHSSSRGFQRRRARGDYQWTRKNESSRKANRGN